MIVLDTTVLIDVLRGHRPALDYVRSLDDVPACSELTRVEVVRGVRRREREITERLFASLRWVGVGEGIARRAGALGATWRRSHRLGTVDLVIAATAMELGASLSTANTRHYPMFSDLEPPY
ncbi:MAG TPA: PIN domain-containing protein [Candidatus Limnocylindria bacterium]|nr:PIN domain-containing protein [Candidatus Limnocylindria bacterium]